MILTKLLKLFSTRGWSWESCEDVKSIRWDRGLRGWECIRQLGTSSSRKAIGLDYCIRSARTFGELEKIMDSRHLMVLLGFPYLGLVFFGGGGAGPAR